MEHRRISCLASCWCVMFLHLKAVVLWSDSCQAVKKSNVLTDFSTGSVNFCPMLWWYQSEKVESVCYYIVPKVFLEHDKHLFQWREHNKNRKWAICLQQSVDRWVLNSPSACAHHTEMFIWKMCLVCKTMCSSCRRVWNDMVSHITHFFLTVCLVFFSCSLSQIRNRRLSVTFTHNTVLHTTTNWTPTPSKWRRKIVWTQNTTSSTTSHLLTKNGRMLLFTSTQDVNKRRHRQK